MKLPALNVILVAQIFMTNQHQIAIFIINDLFVLTKLQTLCCISTEKLRIYLNQFFMTTSTYYVCKPFFLNQFIHRFVYNSSGSGVILGVTILKWHLSSSVAEFLWNSFKDGSQFQNNFSTCSWLFSWMMPGDLDG